MKDKKKIVIIGIFIVFCIVIIGYLYNVYLERKPYYDSLNDSINHKEYYFEVDLSKIDEEQIRTLVELYGNHHHGFTVEGLEYDSVPDEETLKRFVYDFKMLNLDFFRKGIIGNTKK